MFDRKELAETLLLHEKSYELLKWVGRNLQNNTLDFSIAHEAASTSDAAKEWIARHWHNLPGDVRPEEQQLDAFAHLFSSYLTTSFTLVKKPRQQVQTYCGCWCSYCTYLGQANRLQVKTPSKGAKRAAEELKLVYLNTLATEVGLTCDVRQLDTLLGDSGLRKALALATYCRELVRRTRFGSQGEGVLALWRQIAWTEDGSPRPKYKLDADEIMAAEHA
ncbi:MAG: hypothetical protein WD030_09815, partial [Pirellulales bacterium]